MEIKKMDCYYHGTDLFSVSVILKKGLKGGHDNNIWVYDRFSLTPAIMIMLKAKKSWHNLFALQGIEPTRWRHLVDVGFGVIKIDGKGVTGDFIPDGNTTHLLGINQRIIKPEYLTFLGGFNERTLKIQPIDLQPFDELYNKKLAKYDAKGQYL